MFVDKRTKIVVVIEPSPFEDAESVQRIRNIRFRVWGCNKNDVIQKVPSIVIRAVGEVDICQEPPIFKGPKIPQYDENDLLNNF